MPTTAKLPGSAFCSFLSTQREREREGEEVLIALGHLGLQSYYRQLRGDVTEVFEFTHNELRVPSHGNHSSVHCPQQVLHDDLDMALCGALSTRNKSVMTTSNRHQHN